MNASSIDPECSWMTSSIEESDEEGNDGEDDVIENRSVLSSSFSRSSRFRALKTDDF